MKKLLALTMSAVVATSMFCGAAFADEAAAEETTAEAPAEDAAEENAAEDAEETTAEDTTANVPLSEDGEVILEDYLPIEIYESQVAVTDDEISSMTSTVVDYYTTQDTVTEGTAAEGDTVNIDFSGVLEGETEPFDGGTAEGYDIILGSGTFIDGFEDQIIGHSFGETFDISVTFPEDYSEELAGKNATFTITLNYKTVTNTPELTDELVQQFSQEYLTTELNSIDELNDYTYNLLYNNKVNNALVSTLEEKAVINTYKQSYFDSMKEYSLLSLSAYEAYGYDQDTAAMLMGYESADAYSTDEATYYAGVFQIFDKVAADKGVSYTSEDVDAALQDYMASYGYDQYYTLDEFKELNGECWVLYFEKAQVEYTLVTDALADDVVVVPDPVEEVEAEETVAEDAE